MWVVDTVGGRYCGWWIQWVADTVGGIYCWW